MILIREKDFYKNLFKLAIPIVIQSGITYCMGLGDNLMIAPLGDTSISGVYMGNQIQVVLQILITGIAGAITVLSTQYWGKKDNKSIHKIINIGMLFAIIIGALFNTICAVLPKQVIGIFTSSESVIKSGGEYLFFACFSYIFFCITQILISSMRSVENTKIGAVISTSALALDLVLNYIFIYGKLGIPAMGIKGSAVSTVISRFVEMSVIIIYMLVLFQNMIH